MMTRFLGCWMIIGSLLLAGWQPVQAASPHTANLRYVAPAGLSSGACASWETACELRYALSFAVSGDEIWVRQGSYRPGEPGSRSATFQLKSGVALYGGFAGVETRRSQRDWIAYPCLLSGDLLGDDLPNFVNRSDNAYHVVTGSGADATAILDGFVISGGYANGSGLNNSGAGILNINGSPSLVNLTLTGNQAINQGGGMYNNNSASVLVNLAFNGNRAGYDGGGAYNTNSPLSLANLTFSANSALYYGGGMYNRSSALTVTHTTLSANSAAYGGGIYNYSSNPAIRNSILWGNTATNGGSQLYDYLSAPTISYSDVQGGGYAGPGNIDLDPLFVDPANHDLRLRTASPAIDAGDNAFLPLDAFDLDGDGEVSEFLALDLAGRRRLADIVPAPDSGSSAGASAIIDLGAYETSRLYVSPAAAAPSDGSAWAAAFTSLQDALATAGGGVEIWVKQGVYKPDAGAGYTPGDRSATFQLKDDVALYGGFAGDEASLRQRAAVSPTPVHPVVLSGDLLGDDLSDFGNRTDNSYHVLNGSGCLPSARLDGFMIVAGYADASFPNDSGAGVFNTNGSPSIYNTIIYDHFSASYGGGLYNDAGGPSLFNVALIKNSANDGGGIANLGNSNSNFINVTFKNNIAATHGGGLYNLSSAPLLTNLIFWQNTAGQEGGGIYTASGAPGVTNATFNSNGAAYGGGLYVASGAATLANSILWGNSATVLGAQLYSAGDPPMIQYSLVQGGQPGAGNIDLDPVFVDPGSGDLRLAGISPAIDAGQNSALPADALDLDQDGVTLTEAIPYDLAGLARQVDHLRSDTGSGAPPLVDIGAHEAAQNHAPLLDASGAPFLDTILEDSAAHSGTLITDLLNRLGGSRITDPDPGSIQGIALVGADTAYGAWEYSTDGGDTWNSLAAPSEGSARLLAADAFTRLRFIPFPDWNDSLAGGVISNAITFHAWDRSDGAPNGGAADATLNGDPFAISADVETASLHVTPVNDAPSFSHLGDRTHLWGDVSPQNAPGWAYHLQFGPADEQATQSVLDFLVTVVSGAELFSALPDVSQDGALSYTLQGAAGAAVVTVRLQDNGGTDNGGVDTSLVQVFTVTVRSDLRPAVVQPLGDRVVTEDAPNSVIDLWPVFQDAEDLDSQMTYTVTLRERVGYIDLFTSLAISEGRFLILDYAPDANGHAILGVRAVDRAGLWIEDTLTVTLRAVNDPPGFIRGGDIAALESQGAYSAPWATAITPGPADESGQALAFLVVGNDNPGLFGVSPAVAPDGVLSFTPAPDALGTAVITLTLQDNGGTQDGGQDTSASQSLAIHINFFADLELAQSAWPEPAYAGDLLLYRLTVANHGPTEATHVWISDTLPAAAAFQAASPGCIPYAPGGVECYLEALPAGASTSVTLTVYISVAFSGVIANHAVVNAVQFDPQLENNFALVTTTVQPTAAWLFYASNFAQGFLPEWTSNRPLNTTQACTHTPFLGELGNQTASLNLEGLPVHNRVLLIFDLYLLRSWDGNREYFFPRANRPPLLLGPDQWRLSSGPLALLATTFSNWLSKEGHVGNWTQAFPGSYPGLDYPSMAGAAERNSLCYSYWGGETNDPEPMDSIYHQHVIFEHTSPTLTLDFSALGLEEISNESWGLNNVQVYLSSGAPFYPYKVFQPLIRR